LWKKSKKTSIKNFYNEEAQCLDQTSLGIIFSFDESYPYERFIDTLKKPPEFFPEGLKGLI
jgi:hypothetical protein